MPDFFEMHQAWVLAAEISDSNLAYIPHDLIQMDIGRHNAALEAAKQAETYAHELPKAA